MRMACYYPRFFLVLAVAFWTLNVSAQMPGGGQWQAPADPAYEMREISCVSEGNRLYGEAFIPRSPGKHPAVIMSHGYGATHEGFYGMVDTLAKLGYVCYCYDFVWFLLLMNVKWCCFFVVLIIEDECCFLIEFLDERCCNVIGDEFLFLCCCSIMSIEPI